MKVITRLLNKKKACITVTVGKIHNPGRNQIPQVRLEFWAEGLRVDGPDVFDALVGDTIVLDVALD